MSPPTPPPAMAILRGRPGRAGRERSSYSSSCCWRDSTTESAAMDNAWLLVLGVMVLDFILMEEAEDDGMLRNVCLRC